MAKYREPNLERMTVDEMPRGDKEGATERVLSRKSRWLCWQTTKYGS